MDHKTIQLTDFLSGNQMVTWIMDKKSGNQMVMWQDGPFTLWTTKSPVTEWVPVTEGPVTKSLIYLKFKVLK